MEEASDLVRGLLAERGVALDLGKCQGLFREVWFQKGWLPELWTGSS